ncbi:15027_t:CDS:2 [Dentiscutata erythropus]|uniref:15027_t:CDS:1 n=1 Tax=Dentiscutata erythropus TaxID=1348616 RepID=A0A9N9BTC2_9GLOM|nr:15027_t:CDS:2 [Dentiscutata erythropus]
MALTEENNRRHLSNEPAFKSSSSNHISQINENGEQERRSAIKRYGTYDLNWASSSAENISTDDEFVDFDDNKLNNVDSAQVARNLTSSKHSSLQDTRQKFPIMSNKLSRSSFGITVTTTKVVEVLGSPIEKTDSSFINKNDLSTRSSINVEQRHSRQEQLNISSDIKVEYDLREKSQVSFNINNNNSTQKNSFIQDQILLQKQKNRISIGPVKSKGGKRKSLNFTKINQPENIMPRESSFIDPRLLAKKNNYPVKTQTINRKLVKRGQSLRRNKIPPRNMEFAPTSNPVLSNDPTDMDADLPPLKLHGFPWLPGPSRPPQLIHASLVPLPNRPQRTIVSSNTNRNSYISTNKPGRVSNLISSVNVKRNSINFPANQSRLTRINSSRKRASIMIPTARRASLIFRQQILEESLMMSFGQPFPTNPQTTTSTKPLIRKRTKKDVEMENTKETLNGLEINAKTIETQELLTNKENITDFQSSPKQYDQQLKIIDESNSIHQISPPLLSPKTQKLGILGGLFNKQSSGSPLNSPGLSNIPLSLPSSPSQLTKQQVLLPTPRVVKPRRTNDAPPTIQDPEKLRKMEQFEALIASTEAQNSKKSKPGKIRALTTAIIPTTSNPSSSSTPINIHTTNLNAEKKKKKTGPFISNGRRHSGASSNGSENSSEQQTNELKIGAEESRTSLSSLATSVAESVHYRPEEKNTLGRPGPTDEDGVIRVTLTPKVCR